MSHGDVLKNLFDKLGWDEFEASVYYAKKDTDEHIADGWYLQSEITNRDHYLGANYQEALEDVVLFSEKYQKLAVCMNKIKHADMARFLAIQDCIFLDDDQSIEFLIPEMAEDITIVKLSKTQILKYFLLGGIAFGGLLLGIGHPDWVIMALQYMIAVG